MAAIKSKEVVDLDAAIKQANELLVVLDKIGVTIKKTSEEQAKASKGNKGQTAKEINAVNKALLDSNKTRLAAVKIEMEKVKVTQQLEKLEQQKIITEKRALELSIKKKRETERQVNLENKQLALREKEVGTLNKLRIANRQLTQERAKLNLETRKGRNRLEQINRTLDKNNKFIEKNTDALGRQRIGIGRYTQAATRLISVLRQLGLGFGVFELIRGTVGIIKTFDQAVTDLSAISAKTTDELAPLTKQALALGKTTQFTASQITGLQIELAKLGFTIEEIQQATEPFSAFATSLGVQIPEAAKLAGSALRAFGLDASESERVASVLGVATTKTALNFEFLNTALSTVAPVAKTFGFTIEETTALLGQLANSGFDASSAATATRNILLNLADANGILAKTLGEPVTNLEELAAALSELDARGINLAQTLELTDKRSVAAFNTFIDGADTLVDLSKSITDVSDDLQEMSDKRLDSIKGATDLLISAWEGLVLEWNEGLGVGEKIKNSLRFITENLRTIVTVVGTAIKAFVIYKASVIAINIAFIAYAFIQALATKRLLAFNRAGKANLIGAIAAAVVIAIEVFREFNSVLSTTEQIQKNLNDINLIAEKSIVSQANELKILTGIATDNNLTLEDREKAIEKINEISPEYLGNITLENIELEEGKTTLEAYNKQLLETARIKAILTKIDELQVKILEEQNADLSEQVTTWDTIVSSVLSFGNAVTLAQKLTKKGTQNQIDDIKSLEDQLESLLATLNTKGGLGNILGEEDLVIPPLNPLDLSKAIKEVLKKAKADLDDSDEFSLDEGIFDEFLLSEDGVTAIEANQVLIDNAIRDSIRGIELLRLAEEKAEDERKERLDDFKKTAEQTLQIAQDLTNGLITQNDKRIQASEQNIDASESRIAALTELGTAQATEAIIAEKRAIDEEKREISDLERKKRNLLIATVALQRASQLINSGDGEPFENAGKGISNFIKNLPKLFGGTEKTVGEELGSPHLNTSKDAYITRLDKKEGVMTGDRMDSLRSVGLTRMDDIARSAMAYQSQGITNRAMRPSAVSMMNDKRIVDELTSVKKAINNIEIYRYDFDPYKLVSSVKTSKETKRTDHSKRGWRV